jgi:hypothetical protein
VAESFVGPMRSSAPVGSPAQYTDPKQIDAILKSSDPEAVAEAGRSYQKFAAAYEKIAGELLSMRSDLHDAWSGESAAAAAQSQLREVWSAAATVHQTAQTFGVAIERHGSEHLAWYKYNKPPSKDLPEAQSWLTGANERVTQAWGSLPQDLSTSLPAGEAKEHADRWVPGSSGSSGPSGGLGGSGSSGGDSGSSAPFGGHVSDGPVPAEARGGDTQLAGLPPAGSVPGGPLGGGGALPGVIGGFPSGGGGVPLEPPGPTTPPGFVVGGPGLISGGPGSGGIGGPGRALPGSSDEAFAEEAQAGNAARTNLTGTPVGGGSGRRERERERMRGSWMAEDEKVWTGDVQAAPELITAQAESAVEQEPLEIDLSDDTDLIADLLEELNEDPPQGKQAEIAELRSKLARLEAQAAADGEPRGEQGPVIGADG